MNEKDVEAIRAESMLDDLRSAKNGMNLLIKQLAVFRYDKLYVFGYIDPDDESENDSEVEALRNLGLSDDAINALYDNLMNAASAAHQALDDISTCFDKVSSDVDMVSERIKGAKKRVKKDGS